MKIIISAGSYRFHLAPLAVELAKEKNLGRFITAGWPAGWQRTVAQVFSTNPGAARFLDRAEQIPDDLVKSIPSSEFILKLADIFLKKRSAIFHQKLQNFAFYLYSSIAGAFLKNEKFDVYHYRNCYGLASVEIAKARGGIALCDHSIAHPLCLSWMEANEGAWPSQSNLELLSKSLSPLYKSMLSDLRVADYLIVNSDFVKETCVYSGMDPANIHVVYLGVDERFLECIPTISKPEVSVTSLLFAGGWQKRKGKTTIAAALLDIDVDWNLTIAGGVEVDSEFPDEDSNFFNHPNVSYLGILPRKELAELMWNSGIFVFPSYCEGSARVIFEAMAAGCYVITTKNSGSIVEDRVHGRIVEPGDKQALQCAIKDALENPDLVRSVGRKNRDLILTKYRQADYYKNTLLVYKKILRSQHAIYD